MKSPSLRLRFLLAGCLLFLASVASGLWSVRILWQLTGVLETAIRQSRRTIDLTSEIASSLEREDDALLLHLAGAQASADQARSAAWKRCDAAFEQLMMHLRDSETEGRSLADVLRKKIDQYRAVGDGLLLRAEAGQGLALYHETVNPRLREAIAACSAIREANIVVIERAALRAHEAVARGTRVILVVSSAAVLAGVAIATWLARAVLGPMRELMEGVEEIRLGRFDRRLKPPSSDEFGHLAAGFNRMADSLAEYRRSSLGDLLTAKFALESTLNALPDAVLVFDQYGQLLATNPPARHLLSALGVPAATWLSEIPLPGGSRGWIEAVLAGHPPSPRSINFQDAIKVTIEGAPRRFLLSVAPIPAFVPGRLGAVAVFDDVTEFARLDEMRSELIGVASHELKSPLTILQMNLLMLSEEIPETMPRQRQLVDSLLQGCDQLSVTIEELLDVTRIEAGELQLHRVPTDLMLLLERVVQGFRSRFEDARVAIDWRIDPNPQIVQADPLRLASVFTNLLDNALKYSPEGGTVEVTVTSWQNARKSPDAWVQIAITDQGPGVSPEYREQIFEKFFRVENHQPTRHNHRHGTGIGLYLCREIVKAHGGSITCGPGPGGIGTRIALTLPLDR